jgi:hypothetical protein
MKDNIPKPKVLRSRAHHMQMFEIEDVDDDGNHGMTFVLAWNKCHAIQKFMKIHNRKLEVISCESTMWSSFVMWDHRVTGATGYLRRA